MRFWFTREACRNEVRGDLGAVPRLVDDSGALELPARPLRLFVSCAEASGEIHAVNLVRALRERLAAAGAPPAEFSGLGGEALRAEGVHLVADPVSTAAMGFAGVLRVLPFYLRLVRDTARHLVHEDIDLFVPVDSPALHVPLGHVARAAGVPVVHFVTPQYWGWAPWRVGGYRKAVDLALTILPFEPAWFERRGVPVAHVGHPLLDELERSASRGGERDDESPAGDVLLLLPGSRRSVIARNLPVMLEAVRQLREQGGPAEVVVAQSDDRHRDSIEAAIAAAGMAGEVEAAFGDLEGTLRRARAALSVSGTILLHLLHRRLPTVVLYRLEHRGQEWLARHFLTTPFFASVNLLAGSEVYPEFTFASPAPPPELTLALGRALRDEPWRARCKGSLEAAAARLGPPGATLRAASAALARLSAPPAPHE